MIISLAIWGSPLSCLSGIAADPKRWTKIMSIVVMPYRDWATETCRGDPVIPPPGETGIELKPHGIGPCMGQPNA